MRVRIWYSAKASAGPRSTAPRNTAAGHGGANICESEGILRYTRFDAFAFNPMIRHFPNVIIHRQMKRSHRFGLASERPIDVLVRFRTQAKKESGVQPAHRSRAEAIGKHVQREAAGNRQSAINFE